jgi:hypothetical protein
MNLENALENHANGAEVQALAPANAEVLLKNLPEPRKPGFQIGNRANPRGRPPGTYGSRINPLKRLLDFESKEILKKVCAEAKNGNMQAAALVLSRTMPRERLVHLKLPRLSDAASALHTLALVFECVTKGELSPSEADHIAALAKNYAEISELTAIKAQLALLEARVNGT